MDEKGACQVNGCPNQIGLNDKLLQMPYVDALNWHKAPSNAAVRQLWGQLIEGISSRSHVCSNHFVDGKPTAKNPYPTLLLDGSETPEKASQVNKIIESWKQEHSGEHSTYISEHFPSHKTARKGMACSSPVKRTRLVENTVSPNTASPAKKTKMMGIESAQTSSPVRRTRSTESSECHDQTTAASKNTAKESDTSQNLRSTKARSAEYDTSDNSSSAGRKTQSSESTGSKDQSSSEKMASNKFKQTPNSTIPTKRVKLSHESSSQGKDSVADGETMRNRPSAKTKVKDNTSHKEKTIAQTSEGKGVKKPITDVKTSVEDQEPNTSHNTTTNGKYTKVDAPPQLELLGGQPLSPKCRDTMPKLKVYDELKELQELLDGTFKSDQEQVDGDLRPADVENADDLKERILKMSDYPRVIVKRFPLPEGFEFNIKDLFVDVSSLSPVSAQKSKPASSKQIDTKSNNNDIKPIENVKENVPSMSFEEVDEEISIKVSGDENRILEGKETEMDSVTEIPPPSSDTKSSVPEEPLCNQNIKEKPKCANCETHVRHILNITNQLNVLKRRIQRFIGSHNENIITNQKLSYQLKIAREQNKKLESQNAVYRTTIQSIGTNTGQLVKTSDGRFYRLTPKTHAVNQSIPQITAGNQLSQLLSGSVAPNQRPIVHSVGNMVQQQQPQQKTFNLVPSQDPSKPGQVILRIESSNSGVVQASPSSLSVSSVPISQQPAGPVTFMQPGSILQPGVNMVVQGSMPAQQGISILPQQPIITQMQSPVNGQQTNVSAQIQLSMPSVAPKVQNAKSQNVAPQLTNTAPTQNGSPLVPQVTSQNGPSQHQPSQSQINVGNPSMVVQYHNHTESGSQQLQQNMTWLHNHPPPSQNGKNRPIAPSAPGTYQRDQLMMPPPHLSTAKPQPPPLCSIPSSHTASVQQPVYSRATYQAANVQQGNMSTNMKCKMCAFLAREVTRLSKHAMTLKKDFEVLDKINARLVKMFEPASPAFCAFIGVEQIKR